MITERKAILWTDGRYFIQAEKQIEDSEIELFKMGMPGVPTYQEWIIDNLKPGDTVGINGKIFPQSDVKNMEKKFSSKI